jgi:hypothetical protein
MSRNGLIKESEPGHNGILNKDSVKGFNLVNDLRAVDSSYQIQLDQNGMVFLNRADTPPFYESAVRGQSEPRTPVGLIVLFSALSLVLGVGVGVGLTYCYMSRRLSPDRRHSRLGMRSFNSSPGTSKPGNAYVTTNDFKTNNYNNSVAAALLPTPCPPPTATPSASATYAPIREATIKRASTIRANLTSDQNF